MKIISDHINSIGDRHATIGAPGYFQGLLGQYYFIVPEISGYSDNDIGFRLIVEVNNENSRRSH